MTCCYNTTVTYFAFVMNHAGTDTMRKVRDYDAELKALNERARDLKSKKIQQLGELVVATGAQGLDTETLAGVLLAAASTPDADQKEAWRSKGAAFFQRRGRKPASDDAHRDSDKPDGNSHGGAAQQGSGPAIGSGKTSD